MTLEQIQALSDDEIRVMVAELMGWTGIHEEDRSGFGGYCGTAPSGKVGAFVPNYPADLNAAHEMESAVYPCFETATDDELRRWMRYRKELSKAAMPSCQEGAGLDERLIRATARQRCEAFLAVMQP